MSRILSFYKLQVRCTVAWCHDFTCTDTLIPEVNWGGSRVIRMVGVGNREVESLGQSTSGSACEHHDFQISKWDSQLYHKAPTSCVRACRYFCVTRSLTLAPPFITQQAAFTGCSSNTWTDTLSAGVCTANINHNFWLGSENLEFWNDSNRLFNFLQLVLAKKKTHQSGKLFQVLLILQYI